MDVTSSGTPSPTPVTAERPPRLALRFAAYTGIVLLAAGLVMIWVVQRDVTRRAEGRAEAQTQTVAEATLRRHLRRSDVAGPVGLKRREFLDSVFRDRVFLGGVLGATLYGRDGTITYSTSHKLIGTRAASEPLAAALGGSHDRSVQRLEGSGRRVLRTFVPIRPEGASEPIGALALAQDYSTIDVQIEKTVRYTAVVIAFALLALWALLIPILRRATAQLHSRNQQLAAQTAALGETLRHRELAEQRGRELAAIVESSDDAIMATDLQGQVVSWNAGATRLFGYSASEMVGQSVGILAAPERPDDVPENLSRITRGEMVDHFETEGVRSDGRRVAVSLRISPIKDSAGVVTGAAAIARDITLRKQQEAQREALLAKERAARADAEAAQRALAEQNEQLRELDRLKDEFISLVSHELRTPLTSIRGYLELLLDGGAGALTDEQERFLAVVERNSKRLLQLVGDLLFLAQVEAGKLALETGEVDLNEVVADCVEAAKPLADDREIALSATVEATPPMVGDRSRLAQVLDNLVSNALKFTPSGGAVSVHVRREDGDAVIEVEDTGFGIPADEQRHLFERFFRSSRSTQHAIPGTGLGLAIAKTIVERHDGTIDVVSEEGVGTTVRVRLPVKARERVKTEVAA